MLSAESVSRPAPTTRRDRVPLRKLSDGDRVQFTAPANDLKVANRELGTIESIGGDGRLNLKMDDGRSVQLDPNRQVHLDYGYAVTSHSSQGQTADRVLIHVDTELGPKDLLNSRMAYVAISRGALDAQIFTNDATNLGRVLSIARASNPAGSNLTRHRTNRRAKVCPRARDRSGIWNWHVVRTS